MRPIETIRIGEPFLLLVDMKNLSKYTVKFDKTGLNRVTNLKLK